MTTLYGFRFRKNKGTYYIGAIIHDCLLTAKTKAKQTLFPILFGTRYGSGRDLDASLMVDSGALLAAMETISISLEV